MLYWKLGNCYFVVDKSGFWYVNCGIICELLLHISCILCGCLFIALRKHDEFSWYQSCVSQLCSHISGTSASPQNIICEKNNSTYRKYQAIICVSTVNIHYTLMNKIHSFTVTSRFILSLRLNVTATCTLITIRTSCNMTLDISESNLMSTK